MTIEQLIQDLIDATKDAAAASRENTAAIREALSRSTPGTALKEITETLKKVEEAKPPRVKKGATTEDPNFATPVEPAPEAGKTLAENSPGMVEDVANLQNEAIAESAPAEDGPAVDADLAPIRLAYRDGRTRLGVPAFQPKWDDLLKEYGVDKIAGLRKSQVADFIERINAF